MKKRARFSLSCFHLHCHFLYIISFNICKFYRTCRQSLPLLQSQFVLFTVNFFSPSHGERVLVWMTESCPSPSRPSRLPRHLASKWSPLSFCRPPYCLASKLDFYSSNMPFNTIHIFLHYHSVAASLYLCISPNTFQTCCIWGLYVMPHSRYHPEAGM